MGHSITMAALRQKIDERRKARDGTRSSRADAIREIRSRLKGRLKEAADRRTRRKTESREDRARRRARRREVLKKRLREWARRRCEEPLVDAIAEDRKKGAAAWRSATAPQSEGEAEQGGTFSTQGKTGGKPVNGPRRVSARGRGDRG